MPSASILDSLQPSLPPAIWDHPDDPTPTLKPVHAHFIAKHIYGVLERGGYTDPKTWLRLYLTGSLCTYQYSDTSDCDVSLFVKSSKLPEWSRAEMIGLMIEGCDGVRLPGTTYELQAYVVAKGLHPAELYKPGLRAGYSIDKHQWVTPPDRRLNHDVQAQENGFYAYALEQADKMDRMLRYEPDKAIDFWHQIHRRRMRDQKMGKGDHSESNIVYKFLAKRDLFPRIADLSGEHVGKTAGMTRAQYLQLAQAHEAQFGPDRSTVAHTFPDDWTIRRLNTYGDMHREGTLMSNCFTTKPSDEYGSGHPAWYERPIPAALNRESPEYEHETPGPHNTDLNASVDHPLWSLRDPNNLPHLSLDPWAESSPSLLGRHNDDPKPEYVQRVHEWAHQTNDPDIQEWVQSDPTHLARKISGWQDVGRSILPQDISSPTAIERGRSRPVSQQEFDQLAAEGAQQYEGMQANSAPIMGLEQNWPHLLDYAYQQTRQPWGGATIDAHTGRPIESNADAYALSVKGPQAQSVSIPPHGSPEQFAQAMSTAKEMYRPILERQDNHLGIFHDADQGRIDFDPVVVVHHPHDVEAIGAHTHAIGGAYHFKTGEGLWPPHVAEGQQELAA